MLTSLPNNVSTDQNQLIFSPALTEAADNTMRSMRFFGCYTPFFGSASSCRVKGTSAFIFYDHAWPTTSMAFLPVLLHLSGLEMNSPQLLFLLKSPREGPFLHLTTPPAPAAIAASRFCHHEPSLQIRFILRHLLTGSVCSSSHNISSIPFK